MELTLKLTPVQRDILTALANLHHQESRAVKGKEIGELVGRHVGTIRNQMQPLKVLNLVEAVAGPKGGYTATAAAYDALRMDRSGDGDEVIVPVVRNGVVVDGASVAEIVFNNVVRSIRQSCVSIRIIGNIKDFNAGDEVEVGPTPVNKLYIRGKVMVLDSTSSRIVLDITKMISIPGLSVRKVTRRAVRISPNTSLKEASRILIINGVQEALVEDGSPGLVNMVDITRAVAEGRTDLEVRDIMTQSFLTINSDEPIFEAIKMLEKTAARQLAVLDNGVPWGIITPRNLIEALRPCYPG